MTGATKAKFNFVFTNICMVHFWIYREFSREVVAGDMPTEIRKLLMKLPVCLAPIRNDCGTSSRPFNILHLLGEGNL